MSELKTLENLKNGFEVVGIRELRQEAIKWVKLLDKTNEDNEKLPRGLKVDIGDLKDIEIDWEESSEIYGMIKILEHFFNITSEDLEEKE